MSTLKNKTSLFIGLFLLLVVGIPVGIYVSQDQQEIRSQATASTTLYLLPSSNSTQPVQKNVGDLVSFDVMINPGNNMPSVVKFALLYDAVKLKPKDNVTIFAVNTSAFPTAIEGPVSGSGSLFAAVSIGPDVTKAIKIPTKIGTLTLSAAAVTGDSPALISFGSNSEVLSIASGDNSTENVLSTTMPAYVSIASGEPTATPVPSATPTPIATPTPTIVPSATPTPTPARISTTFTCPAAPVFLTNEIKQVNAVLRAGGVELSGKATIWASPNQNVLITPKTALTDGDGKAASNARVANYYPKSFITTVIVSFLGDTTHAPSSCTLQASYTPLAPSPTPVISEGLSFNVFMHGIGGSGDNTNPTASNLSNKIPEYPVRPFKVYLSDTTNQQLAAIEGLLIYSTASGSFQGTVALPSTIASSSAYLVRTESPGHLQRRIAGIRTIASTQMNVMPDATLVAGDINSDNSLDIRDYNLLIEFYSDLRVPGYFNTIERLMADLNDDKLVNQFDYNLFLREISVQSGD